MELYHYNHNHDPKTGKFTFSRGLSSALNSFKRARESRTRNENNRQDIKYLNSIDKSGKKAKLYEKYQGDLYSDDTIADYYKLKKYKNDYEVSRVFSEYDAANKDYINKLEEFRNSDYKSNNKIKRVVDDTINQYVDDPELKSLINRDLMEGGLNVAIRGTFLGTMAEDEYVRREYPKIADRFYDAYAERDKTCQRIANDIMQNIGRDLVDLQKDLVNKDRDDRMKLGYEKTEEVLDDIKYDVMRFYDK